MLEIFRNLVKQERPSFIIDFRVVHDGGLSAVYCKYERNKNFFTAISFFTDTWISKNPAGPVVVRGISPCTTLSDIATIVSHTDLNICRSYPAVTALDLKDYQNHVKSSTVSLFAELFQGNVFGDVVSSSLMLAPVPSVILTVRHGDVLIGTILVLLSGSVNVVFACDNRINDYAKHMQNLMEQAHYPDQLKLN